MKPCPPPPPRVCCACSIDQIYKDLTRSRHHPLGGTAYLSTSRDDEPYLGGAQLQASTQQDLVAASPHTTPLCPTTRCIALHTCSSCVVS
jgi:hypothetical protein